MSPIARGSLLLAILALGLVALALLVLPDQPMVDEHFHQGQIHLFLDGEFRMVPEITVTPGYHLVIAGPAAVFGTRDLLYLRLISAALAMLTVFLAWTWWLRQGAESPLLRSMQILACPLLWPFYVLLYTDLLALVGLLAVLLLADAGRFRIAMLFGLATLFVRQTSVFWLGLIWLMAMHQAGLGAAMSRPVELSRRLAGAGKAIRPALARTWPLLVPLLAFVLFVVVNRGVAVGDRLSHQVGGVYPSQIFFMLLVLWLVLLPLHLANLGRIAGLLRSRLWLVPALVLLGAAYMFSFEVSHHYNLGLPEFHLRNRVLGWLDGDWRWRLFAFPLMAWALLSVALTPLTSKAALWLFPVTVLAMLPAELIEQRYYIPPLVLWLLLRQAQSRAVEWTLLTWFALLSTLIFAAVASTRYFL
ncbi:MAG: hypothetical protein EA370_07395 [Wenzhouxiangella sp.]|nr:MAG: hypothetical protein EA370_07395 [Wenzhouxiangella sp.]